MMGSQDVPEVPRGLGVVQYTISDTDPDTIDAVYHSGFLTYQGDNAVYTGKAKGDTSNGFPGLYTIVYQGHDGTEFGPFDWEITPRGDLFDLHWSMGGRTVIRGFGFGNSERSIIVTYWSADR